MPNALLGSCFYILALLAPLVRLPPILFLLVSTLAVAFSVYLAYVLRYVLHDFCIVCVASYVINGVMFICAARLALFPAKLAAAAKSAVAAAKGAKRS